MAAVLEGISTPPQGSGFVRDAIARMQAAPRFLSQVAWDDLASYAGPIVSGDPEGRVPAVQW